MKQEFYSQIEVDVLTRQILNNDAGRVALMNNQGEIVAHNLNWQHSLKKTTDEWAFPGLGKNILNELQVPLSLHKENALRLILSIKSVLNDEQYSSIANIRISEEGKNIWLQAVVGTLLFDELYILKYRDISKEVAKSTFNKEHFLKLQQLLESDFIGEITCDLNHAILKLDDQAKEILRIGDYEPKEYSLSNFIPVIENQSLDEVFISETEILPFSGSSINAKIIVAKFFEPEFGQFIIKCSFKNLDEQQSSNFKIKRKLKYFEQLFKNTPNGIVVVNERGEILEVNSSFEMIFGYKKHELIGKDYTDVTVSEEFRATEKQHLAKAIAGNEVHAQTFRRKKNGVSIPVLMTLMPIEIKGEIKEAFCLFVDLTEQVGSQAIIEQQLKEKEILLQELHHRVKNNLAVISGLISLESYYTSNLEVKGHLQSTESRIHSIAKIHELIYKNDNFTTIDFVEYLNEVSGLISKGDDKQLQISSRNNINIDVNQAVPFGMLMNEISTIVHKRFLDSGDKSLHLEYEISDNHDQYIILIEDMGTSNVLNFVEEKNEDLATELVSVLLQQLEASYELLTEGKTVLKIEFPKVKYSQMYGLHSTQLAS